MREKIVKDYHSSHAYISKDIYVCGDMTEDVWNMVITRYECIDNGGKCRLGYVRHKKC